MSHTSHPRTYPATTLAHCGRYTEKNFQEIHCAHWSFLACSSSWPLFPYLPGASQSVRPYRYPILPTLLPSPPPTIFCARGKLATSNPVCFSSLTQPVNARMKTLCATTFPLPSFAPLKFIAARPVRTGRYAFPVVLLETTGSRPPRRRYSEIIVTETGNNDLAVDKLP